VCRPFEYNGIKYFDGGISDPVPIVKALEDGCDKVVVVLTLPLDFKKVHKISLKNIQRFLKNYPESAKCMYSMVDEYNEKLEYLKKLQEEGRVLIISPDDCCGVNTLKRTKESITRLYEKGYNDAEKIKAFVEV
jgi:predicted patatin/cPLA2 family phospholipase